MENKDQTKKCYCARCFLPVESKDRVDIEGQNFHRLCSMCCICRTIPTSLKMFYGHVFCNECFKTHVMSRFRGEPPKMHSNSWWMQWAPGTTGPMGAAGAMGPTQGATGPTQGSTGPTQGSTGPTQGATGPTPHGMAPTGAPTTCSGGKEEPKPSEPCEKPEEPDRKRCYCARCLHAVDDNHKVDIGGQCFHPQCARCYFCHAVPTENLKIYYGQVFCEKCFHEHVLNRNKDSPNEFFKACFESWQNNAQFAESMRTFMSGNKDAPPAKPFVFVMGPGQPGMPGQPGIPGQPGPMAGPAPPQAQPQPIRCGGNEWGGINESRKSATPTVDFSNADETSTWDLSFENRTEVSDNPESCVIEESDQMAVEKIAKLTKYLQSSDKHWKKWKNFMEYDKISMASDVASMGWVGLQGSTMSDCPKCLWQCGPIYVNSELLKRDVCCGDVLE